MCSLASVNSAVQTSTVKYVKYGCHTWVWAQCMHLGFHALNIPPWLCDTDVPKQHANLLAAHFVTHMGVGLGHLYLTLILCFNVLGQQTEYNTWRNTKCSRRSTIEHQRHSWGDALLMAHLNDGTVLVLRRHTL